MTKKLSHLTFNLKYAEKASKSYKTLTLSCKDEYEFDLWVAGLKAVVADFADDMLSKQDLLSHSRIFNKHISQNQISQATTKILNHSDEYAETS